MSQRERREPDSLPHSSSVILLGGYCVCLSVNVAIYPHSIQNTGSPFWIRDCVNGFISVCTANIPALAHKSLHCSSDSAALFVCVQPL